MDWQLFNRFTRIPWVGVFGFETDNVQLVRPEAFDRICSGGFKSMVANGEQGNEDGACTGGGEDIPG